MINIHERDGNEQIGQGKIHDECMTHSKDQIDTNGEQSSYQLHESISTWEWITAMTAFPIQ
tara:strand:+ start:324 stop:506 length:183 start_codon:yes stop_codon:yes gene_type:complete